MSSLARLFLPLAVLTALSWTAVAVADAPARGFADPLLGRWNLTIDGPDGRYPSWLEIRLRTESQLMAEFVGRFGSKRHAAAVGYAGRQLELRVPVQYEQGGEALVAAGLRDVAVKLPVGPEICRFAGLVARRPGGVCGLVQRSEPHCVHLAGGETDRCDLQHQP